jgi:SPP1 family predicted phage head-tail adaptor
MAGLRPIRLEHWVSTQNSGVWTESVTKYNVFAEVTRQGGSKVNDSGHVTLVSTIKFKVRYRPNWKPSGNWKVIYDGLRYDIKSIEKDREERFFWNMIATGGGVRK